MKITDTIRYIVEKNIMAGITKKDIKVDESRDFLNIKGSTYISLYVNSEIRGCMGSISFFYPLRVDLKNSVNLSLNDKRFKKIEIEEIRNIFYIVSVLSMPKVVNCSDFVSLEDELRKDKDGLIVVDINGKFVLQLPLAWKDCKTKKEFIENTIKKDNLLIEKPLKFYKFTTYEIEGSINYE